MANQIRTSAGTPVGTLVSHKSAPGSDPGDSLPPDLFSLFDGTSGWADREIHWTALTPLRNVSIGALLILAGLFLLSNTWSRFLQLEGLSVTEGNLVLVLLGLPLLFLGLSMIKPNGRKICNPLPALILTDTFLVCPDKSLGFSRLSWRDITEVAYEPFRFRGLMIRVSHAASRALIEPTRRPTILQSLFLPHHFDVFVKSGDISGPADQVKEIIVERWERGRRLSADRAASAPQTATPMAG